MKLKFLFSFFLTFLFAALHVPPLNAETTDNPAFTTATFTMPSEGTSEYKSAIVGVDDWPSAMSLTNINNADNYPLAWPTTETRSGKRLPSKTLVIASSQYMVHWYKHRGRSLLDWYDTDGLQRSYKIDSTDISEERIRLWTNGQQFVISRYREDGQEKWSLCTPYDKCDQPAFQYQFENFFSWSMGIPGNKLVLYYPYDTIEYQQNGNVILGTPWGNMTIEPNRPTLASTIQQ